MAGRLSAACAFLLAAVVCLSTRTAAAAPNLSTPRQTMETFLKAGRQGDFATAPQCLDLRDVPKARRAQQGVLLAKELLYVLDRLVPVNLLGLPDEAQPNGQGDQVVSTEIPLGSDSVDVALSRVRFDDGSAGWLISRATVAAIPPLYRAYGPPPFYFEIPQVLRTYAVLDIAAWQWIGIALILGLSYGIARFVVFLLYRSARAFAGRAGTPWDDGLVRILRRPLRLLATIGLYEAIERFLALPGSAEDTVDRLARIAIVVGTGWLLASGLTVGTSWASRFLTDDAASEWKNRGLRTQLLLLRRIGTILIGIFAGAMVLLQFDRVRSLGVSLLASAGLAGIVVGLALQKSLTGIIAGIQVSLTQPFRLGDSVVVEGEYGTVEQINLTYVVVRIWDERRLIVPMQRILEQPFQNWTKMNPALMGTVLLRCDLATPVDALRAEIRRLCASCPDWDGRRCDVEVTEITDEKIEVRTVVSATGAEALWRLRCDLREKLARFLVSRDLGRTLGVASTEKAAERRPG